MKRRQRWPVDGVTALSLALCVATAGLWIRSCRRDDQLMLDARYSAYTVPHAVVFGMASRSYFTDALPYESFPIGRRIQPTPFFKLFTIHSPDRLYVRFLGFSYSSWVQRSGRPCRFTDVTIPLWCPLAVGLGTAIVRIVKRKRLPMDGMCLSCGYDLRATPDRCPECGMIPRRGVEGIID